MTEVTQASRIQERAARIQALGVKIFTKQDFTMDEMKEYTRLTNDAVADLGKASAS